MQQDVLIKLTDIIGDSRHNKPPIIPVSKTSWWNGVKSGRYPKPVKLGGRSTFWRASEVYALVGGGQ